MSRVKLWMQERLTRMARKLMDFGMGIVVAARPEWNPRHWSNTELCRLAPLFTGHVINVGAWKDGDKEGGTYRTYFRNAASYCIANYRGQDGMTGLPGEKYIDLSVPVDGSLGTYDLVFSHTVLEHVYPPGVAIDNLCALSRESILVVVPFIQCFHGQEGSYGDYTRFTPLALERLFRDRGFTTVYQNWSDGFPVMNVYLIALATRNPDRFVGTLPACPTAVVSKCGPGLSFSRFLWGDGPERSRWRGAGEFVGSLVRTTAARDSGAGTAAERDRAAADPS